MNFSVYQMNFLVYQMNTDSFQSFLLIAFLIAFLDCFFIENSIFPKCSDINSEYRAAFALKTLPKNNSAASFVRRFCCKVATLAQRSTRRLGSAKFRKFTAHSSLIHAAGAWLDITANQD